MLRYLVYLTVFSGVLGQLVKFPFFSGNFYPLDLLVILTVAFWLVVKLLSPKSLKTIPPFLVLLSLFIFWSLITLIAGKTQVNLMEFLSGSFYLIRFVFYALFSLVIWDLNKNDEKFGKGIVRGLVLSSLLISLAGFIQLLVYPDLTLLAREFGYDPHRNRLVSTFLDPNFAGAYLVLSLILALSLKSRPLLKLLITGLLVIGLILTFSRSAWIMTAAALFLFGLIRSRRLLLFSLLIFFLAYFLIPRVQTRISGLTDPDDSAKLRFISWSRAWEIYRENPFLGVGFNLYRPAQERFGFFDFGANSTEVGGHAGAGSDSSFLLVLATTGPIGLLIFILLWGKILIDAFKKINHPVSLALALSLFGLIFESQFINSLFFPQIMLWLWALAGLSYSQD